MKRNRIILLLALLCTMVQGAWARSETIQLNGPQGQKTISTEHFDVNFHYSNWNNAAYVMADPKKTLTVKSKGKELIMWIEVHCVDNDNANYLVWGSTHRYDDVYRTGSTVNLRNIYRNEFTVETKDWRSPDFRSITIHYTTSLPVSNEISSNDDWEIFCTQTEDGMTYKGQTVKLTNDISVSAMAGTGENTSFQGTFDGGGHTLTFTRGSMAEPFGEEYCAPFRYTNSATIRNLNVKGDIYTSRKFAAGLVSFNYERTTIENCHVSTVIHSSVNGDGTHGGFVGNTNNPVTIKDCVYDGRLLTTNGTHSCGGFMGWCGMRTNIVINSLYAPNINIAMAAGETPITDGATFVREDYDRCTITNSYYTETLGQAQGVKAYTEIPAGAIARKYALADGSHCYMPCSVSGVGASYELSSAVNITPEVKNMNEALTFGIDYTATLNNNEVTSFPISISTEGSYALTLTGKGNYEGAKTLKFVVINGIKGSGSEADPYLISSDLEWARFADVVNSGIFYYHERFVKLTNDITVSEMVGANSSHEFRGTFDGDNHTLTVNYDTSEDYTAPFRFYGYSTIKNLHVDGTITTSGKFAAGIVGYVSSYANLINCSSSVTINSSVNGDGSHGGLVARAESGVLHVDIINCEFDGIFTTTNGTTNCGGFIGWSSSVKVNIKNSIMAPISVDAGMVEKTFNRHQNGYNPTISSSYYLPVDDLPTNQGARGYADAPDGEIAEQQTLVNGNYIYIPCKVSGIATTYEQSASSITPVVEDRFQNALAFGIDYTAKLNDNEVESLPISISTAGDYTLTLDGKGKYVGLKTFSIKVVSGIQGSGTEADPYIVGSTEDWDLLVSKVNSGTSYSGQYVKLTGDISVTQKMGTVSGSTQQNAFSGIFDGGGHTITATISDNINQGAALFSYINGATIKNLNVVGTITSNEKHAAALVSFAKGTCSIENCKVMADVIGSEYVGGIVGHALNSNISIVGCVYSGKMSGGSNTTCVFIGWGDSGTRKVSNCLYLMAEGQDTSSNFDIVKAGGNLTVENCYKTTSAGSYGVQVYTTAPDNEIGIKVTAADNNSYYIVGTVSGVVNYTYTGEVIDVKPTITVNGTTLKEGTDYTYTVSPETVKEIGDYTLTITAQGSTYTGTKTIAFKVVDKFNVSSETTTMTTGAYGVYNDVTIASRITISGNVVLNLSEGATFNAKKGIELTEGNTLTINGPGKLTIDDCSAFYPGIGSGSNNGGALIINGGTIYVDGGLCAAGIGGGLALSSTRCGSVTINGGVVNAKGHGAPGIGGGILLLGGYAKGTDIVINGGQVTAIGEDGGCGMGGGMNVESNIGTLVLGWTNPDDFVYVSSFKNNKNATFESITFAEGKAFVLEGTETTATSDNMAGVKIVPQVLALTCNTDNSEVLSKNDGKQTSVVLRDRTLYKDGKWNTLCLPFDVVIEGSALEGAVARPLSKASISESTLNMTFGDAVTELKAGTPYIIKWESGDHLENPVFYGVTIDKTDRSYDNGASGDERVRFVGTYKSMLFENVDYSILLMGDENKLFNPIVGKCLDAQHAYFKIGSDGAASARIISFNIGYDDGITGIHSIHNSQFTIDNSWYSLDGRKLQGKPTTKGVYINNGKKIVIMGKP